MIDPEVLSRRTRLGARRLHEQRKKVEKQQTNTDAAKREVDRAKADLILTMGQDRCYKEADIGRTHAIICSVGYNDYKRPSEIPIAQISWSRCEPNWLVGHAKIVYQTLQEWGLNPTLDFWHDGVGVESGFNIVAHWSKK